MSFTAAYTDFRVLRDGEVRSPYEHDSHPHILDPEGLDSVHDRVEMSESAFQQNLITGEVTDHSAYPTRTWTVLKGFKTWTPTDAFLHRDIDKQGLVERIKRHEDRTSPPLGYCYNIERMGIPYGGLQSEWKRLFCAVSEHTEPFAVYHSPREHSFPDVTDFERGMETVYYAEFDEGDAYVEERTFEQTETEVLCDDGE
jgi:hypothetical protein